ncbi:hypothetical protein [Persicirhabdus sediminis]|uniref:Uncharacterized protein n=1 Tax=Persicirhabdus sediminis TaxID=454144 RepID=A0A8J7SKF9_9BACT|nr:hypothetical protein [Persicirhabdus sediminis]MBK1792044.1 hypothetical protein [Persicirhabdus sediminis]
MTLKIQPMIRLTSPLTWLAIACLLLMPLFAEPAAPAGLIGKYTEPQIDKTLLLNTLSMQDKERDDYATNLAAFAAQQVIDHQGDPKSLDLARRVLGLSLHLSFRNRAALICNRQLEQGLMPDPIRTTFSPPVLSNILLERGLMLRELKGAMDPLVGRYFVALAAEINPRNQDALFENEILTLDEGETNWAKVASKKIPSQPADQ